MAREGGAGGACESYAKGSPEHVRCRWQQEKDSTTISQFLASYNAKFGTTYGPEIRGGGGGAGGGGGSAPGGGGGGGGGGEFDIEPPPPDQPGGLPGGGAPPTLPPEAMPDLPNAPVDDTAERVERERRERERQDAYGVLQGILDEWGLGELAQWAWDQLLQDIPESRIFIDLRKQDAYRRRFPGMDARKTKNLRALSEDEYMRVEDAYREKMRRWGFAPSKYDDPNDFVRFFAGDISPEEVDERGEIWYAITKAPNTTARLKSMIKQFTGTANVNDQQLFQALVEADNDLLRSLNVGLLKGGVTVASMEDLKAQIQRAYAQEASLFEGGGGRVVMQGGLRTGLTGARVERFT